MPNPNPPTVSMPAEELAALGYHRSSRRYKHAVRIDRPDWLEVLHKQGHDPERSGYSSLASIYRTSCSRDVVIVEDPDELLKLEHSQWGDAVYYPKPVEWWHAEPFAITEVVVNLRALAHRMRQQLDDFVVAFEQVQTLAIKGHQERGTVPPGKLTEALARKIGNTSLRDAAMLLRRDHKPVTTDGLRIVVDVPMAAWAKLMSADLHLTAADNAKSEGA